MRNGPRTVLSLGKGRAPHSTEFKLTLRNSPHLESRMKSEDRGVSSVLVCFGLSQLQSKCGYTLLFGFHTVIERLGFSAKTVLFKLKWLKPETPFYTLPALQKVIFELREHILLEIFLTETGARKLKCREVPLANVTPRDGALKRLSLCLPWKATLLGLCMENSYATKSWQIKLLSVQKIRLVFYSAEEESCQELRPQHG